MDDHSQPLEMDLYSREERILDNLVQKESVLIRFMHWNILADWLAFGFPKVPECYLKKDYRVPLIVSEIVANAIKNDGVKVLPQFIWWCEVDMQDEILKRLNSIVDYDYASFKYDYELIQKDGEHNDAICIYFNTKDFNKLKVFKGHFDKPDPEFLTERIYLMILFENIQTKQKIVVWTAHLKSRDKNRHIRVVEIAEYLSKLNEFLKEIQESESLTKEEVDSIPLIVSGDFNDIPNSPVVLSMHDPEKTKGIIFNSAYCVDEVYPEFTTYCYREDDIVKDVIDYIFYRESPTLKLKSIRDIPDDSEIPEDIGNPWHRWPSDHFSLAATFEMHN